MRRAPSWLTVVLMVAVALGAGRHLGAQSQTPDDIDRIAITRAEAFVDRLAAQDFAGTEGLFDSAMKTALPEDRLHATWTTILSQVGTYRRRTGSRAIAAGVARVVIVSCEFERTTLDLQIAVSQNGDVSGLFVRPSANPAVSADAPSYATPVRYAEEPVTVGSGEWRLPGTLTLPVGAGPFPIVILVHGSGPNDRDETIGAEKPFRDLAWGLASRGIAVLRYEKRTREYTTKFATLQGLTVKDEVVDDVVAAVMAAGADRRIDPRRIVVLGHSLGAMLVPRIAAATSVPAGFIVMAGPARSIDQAFLDQVRYLARIDGTVSADEQRQIDDAERVVTTVRNLRPEDAAGAVVVMGAPASYWLDLRGYDPPAAARAILKPMLVLQGERDYQVTMDDFARWKAALSAEPGVTFKSYAALNHLFIAGAGPGTPQEYERAGHVSEDVILDIAAWMMRLPPRSP